MGWIVDPRQKVVLNPPTLCNANDTSQNTDNGAESIPPS